MSVPSDAHRLLVVGASHTPICGVRDYARVTAEALRKMGAEVEVVWWERDDAWSARRARREAARWLVAVRRAADSLDADWIIWHYSVVTYGWHGAPFLQWLAARRLRSLSRPVLVVLHEYAHDFLGRGWRGLVLGATQRTALHRVVSLSTALIATHEQRRRWLSTRRWLAHRPTLFLPVCAGLPAACTERPANGSDTRLGVIGFGGLGFEPGPVVAALRDLRGRGVPASLTLVGAPGAESAPGIAWSRAAAAEGVADAIGFTGLGAPPDVAASLAALDIVIFPYEGGPTPRKTTLAAALREGKPVVALDGSQRWDAYVDEGALRVVDGAGLSDELERLARDPEERARQGRLAREFYERRQSPDVLARKTLCLIDEQQGRE
jgi:hypothetical protein